MTVLTNNTIQPASGQALTIKDEGGTASITVATNGEATFAENIVITAGKGITFQDTDSSNDSSTANEAYTLDSYEEGDWTPTLSTVWSGPSSSGFSVTTATYTKIGNQVTLEFRIVQTTNTSPNITVNHRWSVTGLPFTPSVNYGGNGVAQIANSYSSGTVSFFNLGVSTAGLRFHCTHTNATQNYTQGDISGSVTYTTS